MNSSQHVACMFTLRLTESDVQNEIQTEKKNVIWGNNPFEK